MLFICKFLYKLNNLYIKAAEENEKSNEVRQIYEHNHAHIHKLLYRVYMICNVENAGKSA